MTQRAREIRQHDQAWRRAPWIGVCALLLFQLAYATHQYQHAAGDVGQYCRICVQFERVDDAPLPAQVAELARSTLDMADVLPLSADPVAPLPRPLSRGPPAA